MNTFLIFLLTLDIAMYREVKQITMYCLPYVPASASYATHIETMHLR